MSFRIVIPQGEYPLFTNIVDEKTFMIAGKTYSAGQELDLTPEEAEDLKHIHDMDLALRQLRQEIIDAVHCTDQAFLPEIQHKVHTIGLLASQLKIAIPLFVMNLAIRMGGRLPLVVDQNLSKVTVRERKTGESVNYTVATALDSVMLTALAEQRTLALALVNPAHRKELTKIDGALEFEYGFQPIEVSCKVTPEDIKKAMPAFLKKHPFPMTMTTVLRASDKTWFVNFASQAQRKEPINPEALKDFAHSVGVAGVTVIWSKHSPKKAGWTVVVANHDVEFSKDGKATTTQESFGFDMNEKGEQGEMSVKEGFMIENVDPSLFPMLIKNPNLT